MVGLPDRFERNLASHGLGFKGLGSLGSESMQQDFHRIYHVSPSYGPPLRAYLFFFVERFLAPKVLSIGCLPDTLIQSGCPVCSHA